MKLLFFILLIGTHLLSYSQDNFRTRQKIYKTSIAHISSGVSSGYLAAINDSAISLTSMADAIRFDAIDEEDLINIHYSNIDVVSLKREGSFGRGMLQGAIIGLATGAITGLVIGGDPPCDRSLQNPLQILTLFACEGTRKTGGQNAVRIGSLGAVGGALLGGIIGVVARKRFIIGGNKEKFREMQMSVMDRMYGSRQTKNDPL